MAWKYRDWVKRYLVVPPFTQHSDAPQHDTDNHGQHSTPIYDEATGFEPSVANDGQDNTDDGEYSMLTN